ncbi:fimbrillin family protein [Dysgonomonas sp. GY75]|uniref:fimbrillin family protein n=1 Tax=Dysgonomonas sp. GY75 TaxID=2780419 RepID=UPI0018840DAA|nr:fimbrillin family protein [Dysgonomonas sp. GY75]MBF0647996.1 fimbrillin family protein [Dysgonomonas sp. GY75]
MEKKSVFSMIVILSLFCACSDSDNWVNQGQEKLLSVAEVGFSLKSSDGTSKSVFEEGDEIGLHIYDSQGSGYRRMTYKNNSWVLQNPVSLFESDTDIYATYPYITDNTDPFHFVIEHTSQTDYLYSDRHRVNSINPVLSLTMMHALSLIEFEFEGMDIYQDAYLDFISIDGWGLYSKAQVDLLSGKLEYTSDLREPAIRYGWQMDSPVIYPGKRVNMMVVPVKATAYEGEIFVNLLIDGNKYHWPVPAGTKWKSGKKHVYKVLIQERLLEIIDVRIEDWIDQGTDRISLPWYE